MIHSVPAPADRGHIEDPEAAMGHWIVPGPRAWTQKVADPGRRLCPGNYRCRQFSVLRYFGEEDVHGPAPEFKLLIEGTRRLRGKVGHDLKLHHPIQVGLNGVFKTAPFDNDMRKGGGEVWWQLERLAMHSEHGRRRYRRRVICGIF